MSVGEEREEGTNEESKSGDVDQAFLSFDSWR
jgi:hypothetical protein